MLNYRQIISLLQRHGVRPLSRKAYLVLLLLKMIQPLVLGDSS